jgi:hypothetical protein
MILRRFDSYDLWRDGGVLCSSCGGAIEISNRRTRCGAMATEAAMTVADITMTEARIVCSRAAAQSHAGGRMILLRT